MVDSLVMDVGSDLQWWQPSVVGDEAVHRDILTVHMAVDPVTNLYRHHRRVEVMVELEEGGREGGGGGRRGKEGGRRGREGGGREEGEEGENTLVPLVPTSQSVLLLTMHTRQFGDCFAEGPGSHDLLDSTSCFAEGPGSHDPVSCFEGDSPSFLSATEMRSSSPNLARRSGK